MNTSVSTQSQAQASAQSGGKKFIDFVTYGTGLVVRARFVKGGRLKTPALYCTISVPLDERGATNGRWTNFDVRVLGQKNIILIESMIPAVTDGKRPRVHFSIGDAYADPYWKQSGDDKRARAQFKGRLLSVTDAKNEPQRPLLSHGLAYVNGIDHARNRLDVGVIHGSVDALEHIYIAATLPEILDLEMEKALDAVIAGNLGKAKVFASVVVRDLQCSAFVFRDNSKHAGQLGTNVNAQLDSVRWIRVEGEKVYARPPAGISETNAAVTQVTLDVVSPESTDEDDECHPWASAMLTSYPSLDGTDH